MMMMMMMMIMTKVEKGSEENGWLGHDREKCKQICFLSCYTSVPTTLGYWPQSYA